MKNKDFDHLLSEIRNEQVDDQVVAQASDRVWKSIAGAPAAELSAHTLRTCEDFQALIPGYLSKQLAPARAMLFEDHTHACVACRHALERARDGERQTTFRLETKRPTSVARSSAGSSARSRAWGWGMAVDGVAAVATLVVAFNLGMLPGQHAVRASVETVDGALYAGSGAE
ncbi:MAG: zf-HC2 domain-containing protein, partial [Candidatus Sulfotelmatobacter sp.]